MRVALGLKTHSGWAALVVVGDLEGELLVVDRRRIELVEHEWAKQPYHAAEEMEATAARRLVKRGVEEVYRVATRAIREIVAREQTRGNEVGVCAVLTGNPMPAWSTDEILSVHFRMHKAEGVLFREALTGAAKECGLGPLAIPEKELLKYAGLTKKIVALGKRVGPPWGKDQKDAALAALIALRSE